MKRTLFFLTLAAMTTTALSGCFGDPNAAAMGDDVTVNWTAYDPSTGVPVASGQDLTFTIGSGQSGLGRDFERQMIGQHAGNTWTFLSEEDPSRPYGGVITTPRDQLEPFAAVQQIDVPRFTSAIGEPTEGMTFDVGFYQGVVQTIESNTVTYEIMPRENQHDHVDFVGIILRTEVRQGTIHQILEADVGVKFTVDEPTPFNPNPPLENLVPGLYVTLGMTDTDIVYGYSGTDHGTDLAIPLEFEVTLVTLTKAAPVAFDDSSFADRQSPVLFGDQEAVLALATSNAVHHADTDHSNADHSHDDGHGHEGHDHDGHDH